MPEQLTEYKQNKQPGITPREIIFKYLHYLPWIVVSTAIMLMLAYVKLRYATPYYSVSGKLLVSKNTNRGSGDKFDDIFMMQQGGGNNLNNEMEIIRSRLVAARVVRSLGLQLQYSNKGKIRTTLIHPKDMPFDCQVVSLKDSSQGIGFLVTMINDNQFRLNEQPVLYNFNQLLNLAAGDIRLIKKADHANTFASKVFNVSWIPLENMTAGLSGSIKVDKVGDFSDVLGIAYETENKKIGLDIVNSYMAEYQQFGLEDKKQQAENTLAFIKEQLDTVKIELGGVERNLQGYREKNRIFAPEQQSMFSFNELTESSKQMTEQGVKLKVVDLLTSHIADQKNPYKIVSTTLGIEEPSFNQQVLEYNRLQLERETTLKTTTAENPLIKNIESGIEKLRTDMLDNLHNIRKTYQVAIDDMNRKNKDADEQIKSLPGKEKQLLEVTRQQKILEELFSFLLQKKLETSIASASTTSNIRVLEPARGDGGPVSPNRKGMYTIALLVGIGLPAGLIFLKEYLNDKVKSREDVERLTSTPIIGEISHADEAGVLVVTKNSRQYIAEQFRIIRSNFQYILPKEEKLVMMVTSSFSGEGKSFVSTNLGAVLAVLGKRTVVLEFDIRKPKIMEGLGLKERKGITNYIVGNVNITEIIYPVPGQDNLFVIPCGPMPPNPAEMLLDEKVDQFFTELKKHFDAIIIDTAPIGLVSDAITLGKHAKACMYIVRYNYTYKKQLKQIDELYQSKKIPNLTLIINDIDTKGGYGGQYGYGSYGYGYGYGYASGSGYFEKDGNRKKEDFFKRVKKIFS